MKLAVLCFLSCALALVAAPPAHADRGAALVLAALERTEHRVRYDGSYHSIAYPGGDVPDHIGVCTDVIVRAYRALGIDLQERVHRDMSADFGAYPKLWGLARPDPNIDHRRVPNLQTYFARKGSVLPVTSRADDYAAGDLVTWMLPGNLPHIGIVTSRLTSDASRPLVVHNIGLGPKLEDMLFAYPITGHYRHLPEPEPERSPASSTAAD